MKNQEKVNEKIHQYLLKQRDKNIKRFEKLKKPDKIFLPAYENLKQFDFEAYKLKVKAEILKNLKDWWVNVNIGIVKDEELFAILFEYNNYLCKNVQAVSYGIINWDNKKVCTEKFDMGENYAFATRFEASYGLTLNFFDYLENLYFANLPEDYKNFGPFPFIGFDELSASYKFSGLVALHEVFIELETEKVFEKINYKDGFMFLIAEHDMGEEYPLLIKYR